MNKKPNPTIPQYIQLAIELNNLSPQITAAQSAFAAWSTQCDSNGSSGAAILQSWLSLFLASDTNFNEDGPNNPSLGDAYSTFVAPILDSLILWGTMNSLIQNQGSMAAPCSFLEWWNSAKGSSFCTQTGSGAGVEYFYNVTQTVNINLSCSTNTSGSVTCTYQPFGSNGSTAAEQIIYFLQSLPSVFTYQNSTLSQWNETLYSQACLNFPCSKSPSKHPLNTSIASPKCPPLGYNILFITTPIGGPDGYNNVPNGAYLCSMNSITGTSNCSSSFLNTLAPNGNGAGAFGLTTHDGNTFFSCTAQTYAFAAYQESGILSVSLNGILNTSTYLNYGGESMSFFPLVSPDGNYVYYLEASYAFDALVANRVPTSSTIYAIETNNLTKSWSVNLTSPVSDTGARLLSLTPNGSNLWVCYAGSSGGIDVISTENQNITNVPIYNCIQVAFSLDSSTAYITTSSAIVVVPTNNTSQTNTITLPNGDTPIAIAITTVGEAPFAYVTANDSSGVIGAIYAIDLSNNNAITTVARGANISANTIEASADGKCVCATNLATLKMGQNNQDFFVIDTSNNSFLILSPDEQNVTGMVILPNNPS